MRQQIKNIVLEEFNRVLLTITKDFYKNYAKKNYNFLLNQMDKRMLANMVFVSSFESKSGFAIETCAKRIARLKFGYENVPNLVNPRNLKHSINSNITSGQIVITDVNNDGGALQGEIATFRANNMAHGRGKKQEPSKITQELLQRSLLPLSQKYKTNSIYTKPVDLAFLMELIGI